MKNQDHATKQQHWVPQLYLKGWSSTKNRLWCFDKINQKIFATECTNVGGGTWFNDVDGTLDETKPETYQIVEKFLSKIEGDLAPLIRTLRDDASATAAAFPGEPAPPRNFLNRKQRIDLSYFIALQSLRTDDVRAYIRKTFTEICQKGMDATLPIGFPDLDPKDWAVEIIENEIKSIHIETFLQFKDYMPYFANKHWTYGINTHSTPLITSDHPVVKIPMRPGDDGFDSYGIQLIFPVSPKLVITMYDQKFFPTSFDQKLGFLTQETVDQYNLLQLTQSRRQIYSSENNFQFAEQWCLDNPEACKLDSKLPEFPQPLIDQMVQDMVAAAKDYKPDASHSQNVDD
jgi:hypothetical protein